MTKAPLTFGFPLYPGFALIDVMAPVQVFGFMPIPRPRVLLIGATGAPVVSSPAVTVTPDTTFEKCPPIDVLVVPGAPDTSAATNDPAYMSFVRERATSARYVVSICVGSLILAALDGRDKTFSLKGKLVTTHWASLGTLGAFPGVTVAGGYPRYVIDGNLISTGGLSSSMDGALAVVGMLRGAEVAKAVELGLQYAPKPPYRCGDPDLADPATMANVQVLFDDLSRPPGE